MSHTACFLAGCAACVLLCACYDGAAPEPSCPVPPLAARFQTAIRAYIHSHDVQVTPALRSLLDPASRLGEDHWGLTLGEWRYYPEEMVLVHSAHEPGFVHSSAHDFVVFEVVHLAREGERIWVRNIERFAAGQPDESDP